MAQTYGSEVRAQVDVKELVTELQKQTTAAAEEHGQYQ
jgi:hypothetical protein